METLHRTGQTDPASLLGLPDEWLRLHMAHTHAPLTGRYDPPAPGHKGKPPGHSPGSNARSIADHHKRRANGPTTGDVAAAQRILEMGDAMPAVLMQNAIRTLQQAGRL